MVGGGGPGVSKPTDPHERVAKQFASEFAQGLASRATAGGAMGGAGFLVNLLGDAAASWGSKGEGASGGGGGGGGGGMSAPTLEALSDTDLPRRDAINRSYIFSPAVDPVWHHIIPLVGAENSEMIRRNLEFNELTTQVEA